MALYGFNELYVEMAAGRECFANIYFGSLINIGPRYKCRLLAQNVSS